MKGTKIMLAFLGTMFITWMCLATLNYLFTMEINFREAATADWVAFVMVLVGWMPSVVVTIDLDGKLV